MTLDIITTISYLTEKLSPERQSGDPMKFEGVEKRLEIGLRQPTGQPPTRGMRNASRKFWTDVLDRLNAKILDVKSTTTMDGYILSESSLFVGPMSVMLITCGTTKLLNCVDLLLEGIKQQNLIVEWVSYSRKNFMFPWDQPAPHCSLAAEYTILRKHFPQGNSFILGPLDGDHYFFYLMDNVDRQDEVDQQLKILMFDLDVEVCKQFYSSEHSINSAYTAQLRAVTGLDVLFEEFPVVHDAQFQPCGYSVNALRGSEYCTIHVTPEVEHSYASFETTVSMKSYTDLVRAVLGIFKPGRFTVHLFLDEHSEAGRARATGSTIGVENAYDGYHLVNNGVNEFQPGYVTVAATFEGKANFVT